MFAYFSYKIIVHYFCTNNYVRSFIQKRKSSLEFLAQFQRQYGYSPTLSEIAEGTGHKSNSTVHTLIRSLVDKGYVQKVDGNTRVLKIVDEKVTLSLMGSKPAIELPLLGYIAAGQPLEPYSDPNATFFVSASLLSGKKYCIRFTGKRKVND